MRQVKTTILLFFLVGSTMSYAQKRFGTGVHGGYHLGNMHINNPQIKTYKGYGGAMFGAWFRFGGLFYVQPELNYHFSGTHITYNNAQGIESEGKFNTHYIQAVVSPGVRPINKKLFQLRLGPTASYSFMVDENLRKFDMANSQLKNGVFHAGFFTGVNVWRFSLDLRYFVALNNQSSIPDQRFKSDSFQAALGFTLFGR